MQFLVNYDSDWIWKVLKLYCEQNEISAQFATNESTEKYNNLYEILKKIA